MILNYTPHLIYALIFLSQLFALVLVYASLDTCCSHFLTIIAGVDLHFRHESKLPVCQDQFRQEWSSTMEASSKCVLYRNLKNKFELEAYLLRLPRNVWKNIVKLRCCNHKLEIETG